MRARKEEENGAWSKLFDQVLHESSVNSIAWAPHVFGLILATASADGKVCVLSYKPESNAWERDVIQVRARCQSEALSSALAMHEFVSVMIHFRSRGKNEFRI